MENIVKGIALVLLGIVYTILLIVSIPIMMLIGIFIAGLILASLTISIFDTDTSNTLVYPDID